MSNSSKSILTFDYIKKQLKEAVTRREIQEVVDRVEIAFIDDLVVIKGSQWSEFNESIATRLNEIKVEEKSVNA